MGLPAFSISRLSANGTSPFGRWATRLRFGPAVILTCAAMWAGSPPNEPSHPLEAARVRLEATPFSNGSELLTVFVALPADQSLHYREMPVLSVVRDTLGSSDPKNERLRDVWLLTAGRPSPIHSVESAVPFVYWLHTPRPSSSIQPVHLLDFGSPVRQTESAVAGLIVQGELLDPEGRALRTTSRSYRMNGAEDSSARASQAIAALADAEQDPSTSPDVADDLARLHARLLLSNSLLGGLVRDQRLLQYHDRQQTEREMSRGHNWDLLRQAAEADKLYFEPLSVDGGEPSWAMLWVRRADLAQEPRRFNAKLLHIANPFHDGCIASWRGYSEQWWFDANGRHVDDETPGAVRDQVIPLALYSLDDPRMPLLLIDFQNGGAPRRRESAGQAADDVTRGLLGWTPITNWYYFMARTGVMFVLHRQGEVSDRTARVRAWAQLSYALSAGGDIRPGLREALQQHVHAPVFDPQHEKVDAEAALAWNRWRLLTGAESPVPKLVEARRRAELAALEHNHLARFGFLTLHAATLGAYEHRDDTSDMTDRLAWARQVRWNRDYLSRVAGSPRPVELTWDADHVLASVADMNRLLALQPVARDDISPLLARLAVDTDDDSIRHVCLEALNQMDTDEARRQLAELARQPGKFDCPVCREYLARRNAPVLVKASFVTAQ